MSMSEVALLRQRIELELEAVRRAMYGPVVGTARHTFISARMERVGVCRETLAHHIGSEAAMQVVGQLYVQTMEEQDNAENQNESDVLRAGESFPTTLAT